MPSLLQLFLLEILQISYLKWARMSAFLKKKQARVLTEATERKDQDPQLPSASAERAATVSAAQEALGGGRGRVSERLPRAFQSPPAITLRVGQRCPGNPSACIPSKTLIFRKPDRNESQNNEHGRQNYGRSLAGPGAGEQRGRGAHRVELTRWKSKGFNVQDLRETGSPMKLCGEGGPWVSAAPRCPRAQLWQQTHAGVCFAARRS